MIDEIGEIRRNAIRLMLRPLVRFFLRGSHTIQEFYDLAKQVFVEIAVEEIEKSEQKLNVSRVSVLTGLHRQDVSKLMRNEPVGRKKPTSSVVAEVIGQWESNPLYTTKAGKPRTLVHSTEDSEFYDLVGRVSKDTHPNSVLAELQRRGLVHETSRGLRLELGTVPEVQQDPEQGFQLLALDMAALVEAVEENVLRPQKVRNLHLHTEYDNIVPNALPKIRRFLNKEGRVFHKKVREFVSQFDRDINPEEHGRDGESEAVRVTVGSFSYNE